MVKTILLCFVQSFTTLANFCQCTAMWNRCSKLLQIVSCIIRLTFASSIRQRVRRGLIILRY